MGILVESDRTNALCVLLVDDNPSWAEMAAEVIEGADDEIDVTTVADSSEARHRLNEASFDCVVSDYSMPGMSGLELLKKLQRGRPDLSYILITAKGDEQTASEAIAAGVDDYLTKSSATDHPELFVNRIRNAVRSRRNHRKLKERNEWYEAIAATVREAICLYQNGDLIYVNQQFCDLVGRTEDQLRETDPTAYVHEEDVDRYNSAVGGNPVFDEDIRLVNTFGDVRHCLLTAKRITVAETPTIACVIRDITSQRTRERELQRELETKEAIWDVLVHNSTREEVAHQFCYRLTEQVDAYDLAVVTVEPKARDDDERTVVAAAGNPSKYASAVQETPTGQWREEPTVRAASTEQPVVVDNLEGDGDGWQGIARRYDVESVMAVPIEHDRIVYGALGVYATTAQSIDVRRPLLEDLAETLGYAFSAVEVRETLLSDAARRARVGVTDDRSALVTLANAFDGAKIDVTTVLTGEETDQFYARSAQSVEGVETTLSACQRVVSYETQVAPSGETRFQAELTPPCVSSALLEQQASLESATLQQGRVELIVRLSKRSDTGALVDALADRFDGVTLAASKAIGDDTPSRPELLEPLTDRQLEAIEAAYRRGYFEQPKQASAQEVADDLDIGRTTFTQHLRSAERKLLGTILDSDAE